MKKTQKTPTPSKVDLDLLKSYSTGLDYGPQKVLTIAQIKDLYGPARSLGIPEDRREDIALAQDSALMDMGFYSLVQHSFSMGQSPQSNPFVGYAALSGLRENGLIKAAVGIVVDDMFREWIEVKSDDDGRREQVDNELERLQAKKRFKEAAEYTQYFGGCLVYLDTGVNDPETLRTPLNLSDKSGELVSGGLRRLVVVEPINISPGNYNANNPLREDYFEPKSWWVLGREVHASRFIKFTSGDLPILLRPSFNFFGIPHAQILWDYVLHFQQNRVATSRMLSKYSDYILKLKDLRDAMTAPNGLQAVDGRLAIMSRYRSNDGITAIDLDNEDVVKVESSLAGLVDITKFDLENICAINQTPAVKLLGISPSGFNATGESDIRNYYDHVSSQQDKLLFEPAKKLLHCIQLNIFGGIDPGLQFEFKKLGGEDRQLESTVRKSNSDTMAAMVMAEIVTPEGARAAVKANPDEYLHGLVDGINSDEEAIEAMGAGEFEDTDTYGLPDATEPSSGPESETLKELDEQRRHPVNKELVGRINL